MNLCESSHRLNVLVLFCWVKSHVLLCLTEQSVWCTISIVSRRTGRDRIVVSTSRCGRDNPGSNPGHGITTALPAFFFFISLLLSRSLSNFVYLFLYMLFSSVFFLITRFKDWYFLPVPLFVQLSLSCELRFYIASIFIFQVSPSKFLKSYLPIRPQ